MKLIQLQRLDPTTKDNQGGLYINVDHISALIPFMDYDTKNNRVVWCYVLLSNQIQYLTPFSVQDIYELCLDAERSYHA